MFLSKTLQEDNKIKRDMLPVDYKEPGFWKGLWGVGVSNLPSGQIDLLRKFRGKEKKEQKSKEEKKKADDWFPIR